MQRSSNKAQQEPAGDRQWFAGRRKNRAQRSHTGESTAMSGKFSRLLYTMAGLLLLILAAAYSLRQLRPAAKPVPTTRVQKGTLRLDIHTTADLHTPYSAMVVAPSVS